MSKEQTDDTIIEGQPLQVTILGCMEHREIWRVKKNESAAQSSTLALGAGHSYILLGFPQPNGSVKTFVLEVPEAVVNEYSHLSYLVYSQAHPEMNLPEDPKTLDPMLFVTQKQ